jgi:hypothetical protein
LRRSLYIFAAALLGGLIGFGVSSVRPPVYRATAILAIGIDYARSQWLDEDADRLVMGRVQDVILSDEVLADGLQRAQADAQLGPSAIQTISELREGLRMVWVDTRWELSYAGPDPGQAATMANAWAEAALEQLQAASDHAWRVAELQSLFFRVYCRPQAVSDGSPPMLWTCDEGDPSQSSSAISQELRTEIQASRGIIPALSFDWERRATPPVESEHTGRPLMMLGGLLAGLMMGALAAAAIGEPHR